MAGLLGQIRKLNRLGDRPIAEPFAGGAGASLSLLYLEEAPSISINDKDPSVFAIWWSLLNRSRAFLDLLSDSRPTMAEWRRQRDVYRSPSRMPRVKRGFAAFYLNRCNRSGIIMNGGPIGGVKQAGKWKLGARFNKEGLRKRCEKVHEYRERIETSCVDGLQFIKGRDSESTFFFIDPPYFEKGPLLYLNALGREYHQALASQLRTMAEAAWILTYDDCPEIRALYRGWASVRPFSLRYAAAERRGGREVLIAPKWMRLPKAQESAAIAW